MMGEIINHRLVVGVDEAGYGPNLGPLLVVATSWLIPLDASEQQVIDEFSKFSGPNRKNGQFVPLADSKKLYKPGKGLESLELGLLAFLGASTDSCTVVNEHSSSQVQELGDRTIDRLGALMRSLANGALSSEPAPWYQQVAEWELPVAKNFQRDILDRLITLTRHSLHNAGMEFLGFNCQVVTETEFNALLERLGSKGMLLSRTTCRLVAETLHNSQLPKEVFCDRQGGRKNYLPVLLDAFPDSWFETLSVSDRRCSYVSRQHPNATVHFSVGGDSFPPTALASMLAKYLRERFMREFNKYWCGHIPGLRNTAGYPVDAKRFRDDISATARQLGLSPSVWWRNK